MKSLISEPAASQGMPVKTTEQNFGRVRNYYIETLRNHYVGPKLQEHMITQT